MGRRAHQPCEIIQVDMTKLNKLLAIILALGAVLWNGWVFGWLNHGTAGYLRMSISELEALRQPYGSLFNILEDLSGGLMIIGSLGFIAANWRKLNKLLLSILICITAIGALTLYDVANPVDCNRYHNPACMLKWDTEQVSNTQIRHVIESDITLIMTVLLALLVLWWVYSEQLLRRDFLAIGALTICILITLVMPVNANTIVLDSVFERLWNVLVSVDIAYVGLKLFQAKLSKSKHLA